MADQRGALAQSGSGSGDIILGLISAAWICFDDLPHPSPLPTERGSHYPSPVCSTPFLPTPSHDIPQNRRMILLLPGGEGRDEGERLNQLSSRLCSAISQHRRVLRRFSRSAGSPGPQRFAWRETYECADDYSVVHPLRPGTGRAPLVAALPRCALALNPSPKAMLKPSHSRRFATATRFTNSRSVWTACVFSAAFQRNPKRRIPPRATTRGDSSCTPCRAPARWIFVHDLPHLFALPKERTYRGQISVSRMTVPPIPSLDMPRNRRTILLLPGGEGRDEGERKSILKQITRKLMAGAQTLSPHPQQIPPPSSDYGAASQPRPAYIPVFAALRRGRRR
jgi:hypothetical protein